MNIGIDLRPLLTPHKTGVGEFTFELLDAIFKLDQTNQYFLFYNCSSNLTKNIPVWKQPNITYVATRYPNKILNASLKYLKFPKLDRLVIRHANASIHHLDYWFSPDFGFTILSQDVKQILTVHDLSYELFPQFYTIKQRWLHTANHPKKHCQQAHKIIVPSENTKRDIVENYQIPPEKITVIYPGLSPIFSAPKNINLVRKKYFLPENFILFLGTIEPRKNIIGLIEAFEQIYHRLPQPHSLVIAGSAGWKNSKIYARAQKSPMRDQIKFIGYIPPEEKPSLYAAASIFVYPSFYEGFGFPVLEAMNCGVPVITSNRSSLSEITGNAATLINPQHANEIAETIFDLLTKHNLRASQIKNGLEQSQKFSWNQAAREWLNLFN